MAHISFSDHRSVTNACGVSQMGGRMARNSFRTRFARVAGGFETHPGEYPWTAAIKTKVSLRFSHITSPLSVVSDKSNRWEILLRTSRLWFINLMALITVVQVFLAGPTSLRLLIALKLFVQSSTTRKSFKISVLRCRII
ncbi:hypothetical protein DICVIV_08171 [Dictyocaulus viviparus]|uniref:Uncharacterized protein n=1 Tax=Dictyocaulus viviparus TaxID=29172 RepID=A0A0D8XMM9_DICVI|nr:hypothetical protein DICVIV_08171 [Dictyocaulus viviparus]